MNSTHEVIARALGLAAADRATASPELGAANVRGGASTPRAAVAQAVLDRGLTARLERPQLAALAALAALVHRYSGQDEVVVASLRPPELAGVAGCLTPPLPLRLDLGDDPSFTELMVRVERAWADAQANRAPDTARPDLALGATESGDGLQLRLEYSRERFEPPRAARLLEHLETLLWSFAADGEQTVTRAAILPHAERARLLAGRRARAAPYPDVSLPELIAATASRDPDRQAVTCGEQSLSYGELERRSAHVAGYLRALGAGRGSLVGVCVERSVDLLVAVLGVLKAGAAYVPVDPSFPPARQALMLEDSAAPVVITQAGLRTRLPSGGYETVCIDADWSRIARATAVAEPVAPDECAYVIYTSGSTGRPKGVEITHRSLVNFLWSMRERPGLSAEDVLVAVTTLSFDIAALELFLPLVVGARTVIATSAQLLDPAALAGLLERSGASVLQATPLRWRMLVEAGWAPSRRLKGLCGGEALPAALAEQLTGLGVELWNMYGPTETSIWSTCARIHPGDPVTIGDPIANTSVHILDRYHEPVPVGAVGELWIGGDGVARGYHRRPELTAERFVPVRGERLYRTGDLARCRDDGRIEFLGRADHQVKLRGFRIELAEIEALLVKHESVRSAAVVVRDERLIAYVIPAAPASAQALRAHLARALPEYMLPAEFVTLAAFPETPNGKIDRAALPPPGEAPARAGAQPPATELERAIAGIWRRLLGASEIGVDDDFFAVGGHSLLAVQLVHAVETELGSPCTIGVVLRTRTIRGLASELQAGGYENTEPVVLELAAGTGPNLFCLVGVNLYQKLAERLAPELSAYGIFLPAEQGMFAGRRTSRVSLEALAAAYVSVVRDTQPTGPYNLLGFCFGGLVAYEVAQQLRAANEEVAHLVMLDTLPRGIGAPAGARLKSWAEDNLDWTCDRLPDAMQRRLRGEAWLRPGNRLDRARSRIYGGAERRYRQSRYPGRTILVQPDESTSIGYFKVPDASWGWDRFTPNLSLCPVPGAHTTIFAEPHVDALAAALRAQLAPSGASLTEALMTAPAAT